VTASETAPRTIVSRDQTPIAVFSAGTGPPVVLVHGATADHTTWRTSGPLLAARHTTHAIDRRGRNPLILLSTLSGAPCPNAK